MEFSLVQLKDHLKNTVEATCRGDPGAVFLSSTVRTSIFATQVKYRNLKVKFWVKAGLKNNVYNIYKIQKNQT